MYNSSFKHLISKVDGHFHVSPLGVILMNVAKLRHQKDISDLDMSKHICETLTLLIEQNNFVITSTDKTYVLMFEKAK